MTTEETEEDPAFDQLLRSIARTPDVSALRRDVRPGSELIDRFVMGRQLGEGGMGRVFAAFDRQRQVKVAIKMLGVLTPHSIVALKREFRSVAELAHPNIVRLYELFSDGEEWFFSMELLEGLPLRRVLAERPGDFDVVRHVFRQLAFALAELHGAGILHGDLKPSNFLIVGPEHRAVLLDFGVSRPLHHGERERRFAGTRAYSAPEQIACGDVTEAADWYAFGRVLLEALSGSLPPRTRFDAQLGLAPPELSTLCRHLLQEEPSARATAREVHRMLGAAEPPPATSATRRSGAPPQLFGRGEELERLFAAYSSVRSDNPGVVLVRGDSGIGKTALVDFFAREVARRGAVVLSGRCRDRESTSYKAIDGLIDDLVKYLDSISAEVASRLLPDGLTDLTRLFPALRTAEAVATHAPRSPRDATSDQTIVKQRAIAALRDLFEAIAAESPLVMCIDDLQWSDVHSAALLEPILTGPKRVGLLFLGVTRSLGALHGSTIDALYAQDNGALPALEFVDLSPLSKDAAESFARELLPINDAQTSLARDIAREAGGSPLFIAELAHHVGNNRTPAAIETQGLTELVQNRIAALPVDVQALLEATAVAGVPLSVTAARRCNDLTPNRTEEAIDLLKANHLVRTHDAASERSVEVQHDRIREIVLHRVALDVKRSCHLRLAQAFEAERTVLPEIVAGHFFAAGHTESAGRYWIKAADAAFEALAFGHAGELYRRGEELAKLEPGRLAALQVKRAEALAHDGKGALAADVYLIAAEEHDKDQAIELRRRAAEQLLLSGHLDRGLEVIARVLRDLGMRRTRTGRQVIPSILLGRLLVRMRGLRFKMRKASEISQRELARVDASWSIAFSLGVTDFMRGADFQNDHLLLALHAGEPRRLLRALTLEISYSATPGPNAASRTAQLLALADELARAVDDPVAHGLVRVSRGVAAYLNGRFAEALVECKGSLDGLRRRSGTVWESVTAQRFVVASLFHLGKLAELAEFVPPLLAEADAKGNLYASTYFRTTYSNAAWLHRDAVESAREQLRIARAEWRASGTQLTHSWMLLGECQLAFYTGDSEPLWEKLAQNWPRLRAAQFFRIGMVRIQLCHLRSLVSLQKAWALARAGQNREARALCRQAQQFAQRVRSEPQPFCKPLAELLLGGCARFERNDRAARQHLESSVQLFDAQDMQLYAAAARVRLGELIGGDAGSSAIRRGWTAFEREGVANVARCVNMLAPISPAEHTLLSAPAPQAEN